MKKVVLFFVIILFPQSIIPSSSAEEPKQFNGLIIDLIHRDSPLSPFYNSSMTKSEVLINAALRSISRNNRFNFTTNQGIKDHETVIVPNKGNYLMKIFIGTPQVASLALADTGSDLIWVQCLPCEQCYKQKAPIFDPKHSSTYEEISCNSRSCGLWDKTACGSRDQCRYFLTYADQSYLEGDMAKDIISFGHSTSASPKPIFGCGHDNSGLFDEAESGVVGLGSGPLSLISQLGHVIGYIFSYCLLPYDVKSTSKLKIGSTSTMPANKITTSFMPKSRSYSVPLYGITIGDVFANSNLEIVIDSGTPNILLMTSLYNRVERIVAEAIDKERLRVPPKPYKLCYSEGSIEEEEYPDISFHFPGAIINLLKDNVFVEVGSDICLAMLPTNGSTVFGSLAQTSFKVEFDLTRKTVSFAPADCTKE